MTVLDKLEKWVLDYEEAKGTPTMCEIKAQIQKFKKIGIEELKQAYSDGLDFGYTSATNYEEPDNDEEFEKWFRIKFIQGGEEPEFPNAQ